MQPIPISSLAIQEAQRKLKEVINKHEEGDRKIKNIPLTTAGLQTAPFITQADLDLLNDSYDALCEALQTDHPVDEVRLSIVLNKLAMRLNKSFMKDAVKADPKEKPPEVEDDTDLGSW